METSKHAQGKELSGNWRKSFDFRFLSGEDLEKPVTVTIDKTTKELARCGQGKPEEEVVVIWFKGTDKGLVCNKTNHKAISKVIGSAIYETWKGKKIILMSQMVDAFGGSHNAVRVKEQRVV